MSYSMGDMFSKLFVCFFAITLFSLLLVNASALECGNETIKSVDCNIMVIASPDTTSCDMNTFKPNGDINTTNFALINPQNRVFYRPFKEAITGEWLFSITCNGNAPAFTGGSIKVVDANIASYVDTLESGQTTITGNQATLQTLIYDVNADIDAELNDINATVRDANRFAFDANRFSWDANRHIQTDINVGIYTGGTATVDVNAVADAVWTYTGVMNQNVLDRIANAVWGITTTVQRFVNGIIG